MKKLFLILFAVLFCTCSPTDYATSTFSNIIKSAEKGDEEEFSKNIDYEALVVSNYRKLKYDCTDEDVENFKNSENFKKAIESTRTSLVQTFSDFKNFEKLSSKEVDAETGITFTKHKVNEKIYVWVFKKKNDKWLLTAINEKEDYYLGNLLFVKNPKGEKTKAVTSISVNGTVFKPTENKSEFGITSKNFTMRDKPAFSVGCSSYDKNGEKIGVDITFNKAAMKKGAHLISQKIFNPDIVYISATVYYKDKMFTHLLYDEFDDVNFEITIDDINKGVAYCRFFGKLYDTVTDRNSIDIYGKMKFEIE